MAYNFAPIAKRCQLGNCMQHVGRGCHSKTDKQVAMCPIMIGIKESMGRKPEERAQFVHLLAVERRLRRVPLMLSLVIFLHQRGDFWNRFAAEAEHSRRRNETAKRASHFASLTDDASLVE